MKNLSTKLASMRKLSQRNTVHYKSIIGIHTVLASALFITGCQSTSMGQSGVSTSNPTPAAAKTVLAKALQQQRRQSFAYHTNLEVNNDQQVTAVNTKNLVASDYIGSYCEDAHDQAYAALLAQAETLNKDISAVDYDVQRTALKASYLECNQAYQAWDESQPDSDDYDYDSEYSEYDSVEGDSLQSAYEDSAVETDAAAEESKSYSETAATEPLIIQESTKIVSAISANQSNPSQSDTITVSPYYQQLFDDYDNKSTALDVKKAKLLDAYLLKPASANAQGVYQPLAGKFTMLASGQYKARNNHSSINQPIYVDFKTGNIYLWADNFALINSELLDDKLGTKWQNKWLKIEIDDGTLPKGFGSAVIKSHFAALDQSYNKAPIEQFDFVAPSILTTLSPKLPAQQLTPMLQSKQIIRRLRSDTRYEESRSEYLRNFYDLIVAQYPELLEESVLTDANDLTPISERFTSKVLVQKSLALMKSIIDNSSDTNVDDVLEEAKLAETAADKVSVVQELYGFNARGQMQWQHLRFYTPKPKLTDSKITTDILQQYLPIRTQDVAFPNLPSTMQTPNASNSVDLRQYSNELFEYYRDGSGTMMGKMFFNMMPMNRTQYEDYDDSSEEDIIEEDMILDDSDNGTTDQ